MKKGLAFWFAILLSVSLVAGGLWVLGEPASSGDLARCLPRLNAEGQRLILQGRPADLPERLPSLLVQGPSPLGTVVDGLLPLLRLGEEFLLAVEAEGPSSFVVLRLPPLSLRALQGGKLPPGWDEAGFIFRDGGRGRSFVLQSPRSGPLQGRLESDLVLLSSGPSSLSRFDGALAAKEGREDLRWDLRPQWPTHLRLNFGGEGAFRLSLAWKADGMPNELVWRVEPFPRLEGPRTAPWSAGTFHLPLLPDLVAGWRLSPDEIRFLKDLLEKRGEGELPFSDVDAFGGPALAVFGAPARLLGLPLPGAFVEGTGEEAVSRVDAFWRDRLGEVGLSPSPVDGFPSGGATFFPLTLTAVADGDGALIGVVDGRELPPRRPLADFLPGLAGEERFWLVADLPRLCERLQTPETVGRLLSRFGRLPLPLRLLQTLRELSPLGRLVLILPGLDSGWVTWTRPTIAE